MTRKESEMEEPRHRESWNAMQHLIKNRLGQRGIEFPEIEIVGTPL